MGDNAVATTQERNITDKVLNRVKALEDKGELKTPQNYSPENALKSAYLILQETTTGKKDGEKPVLQACSEPSIANALLDMVIQGLSPAKKQCYFVAYGKKLQLMRSYMGTVAVTKRLNGVKDIKAYCIFDGDEFETEYNVNTAVLKITKFNPKFENIDINKIKGAFAVILGEDGPIHTEIMNMNQIRNAWNQGYAKGGSGAHKNFTEEMAKKTVINRACKMFANTSDDSDILIGAFNNSDKADFEEKNMVNDVEYEVKEEIQKKANTKPIGFIKGNAQAVEYETVKEDPIRKPEPVKQVKMEGPGF
ncbi:recombinase RecT [Crassaminicella profunda]|uniref:recombinase RecT n=1 Tax=Crassaminicella profunda TaxID=1286698 RepID=UPI001CA7B4AA|nr:recombinase RecT [Crassaminicella profunda]QZY56682.1 recombinase RecT [Crassaminicella profunda]